LKLHSLHSTFQKVSQSFNQKSKASEVSFNAVMLEHCGGGHLTSARYYRIMNMNRRRWIAESGYK